MAERAEIDMTEEVIWLKVNHQFLERRTAILEESLKRHMDDTKDALERHMDQYEQQAAALTTLANAAVDTATGARDELRRIKWTVSGAVMGAGTIIGAVTQIEYLLPLLRGIVA